MKNIFNKTLKPLNSVGISHIMIPLLVVMLVAVGGTFLLVSSHAATTKSKNGVIVINNGEQTDYKYVRIQEVNPNNTKHTCAGKTFGKSSNFVVKKLNTPDSTTALVAPLQFTCSAIGGNTIYNVTYSEDNDFTTTVSEDKTNAVDIDEGWCTSVNPDANQTTKTKADNGKCAAPNTKIPARDIIVGFGDTGNGSEKGLSVLDKGNYINGLVSFKADGHNITQSACTGQAYVIYTSTTPGAAAIPPVAFPLKWDNPKAKGLKSFCVIKLTQLKTPLAAGAYKVTVKYAGSKLLNPLPEAGVTSTSTYTIKPKAVVKRVPTLTVNKFELHSTANKEKSITTATLTAKPAITAAECTGSIDLRQKTAGSNAKWSDAVKNPLIWNAAASTCGISATGASVASSGVGAKYSVELSFPGNAALKAKTVTKTTTAVK